MLENQSLFVLYSEYFIIVQLWFSIIAPLLENLKEMKNKKDMVREKAYQYYSLPCHL